MANIYTNIPVPTANGAGAWVDISASGAEKTIVLGGDPRATINIEISNETGAPSGDGAPVATFQVFGAGSGKVITCAAKWMRAVVADYKSGTGVCTVGANDDGTEVANLPATAGDGTGTAVDVSSLGGNLKTVTVLGTFRGSVIVEISENNVEWAQAMVFTNSPRFQSKIITAKYMRVRRGGVPTISPGLPQVDVGVVPDVNTPPSFKDPELVTYVATGAEGSAITVPITARATTTYYVGFLAQSLVPVGSQAKVVTSIPAASRAVNQFVANLSAPAVVGDTWQFLVVGE